MLLHGSILTVFRYSEHPDFVTDYHDRRFGNPAGLPTFAYIFKAIVMVSRYSNPTG